MMVLKLKKVKGSLLLKGLKKILLEIKKIDQTSMMVMEIKIKNNQNSLWIMSKTNC